MCYICEDDFETITKREGILMTQEEKIQTKNFCDAMESNYIPRIESMANKEMEHLRYLVACRDRYPNSITPEIIENSESMLHHLESRVQEYKDYVTQKRKEIECT